MKKVIVFTLFVLVCLCAGCSKSDNTINVNLNDYIRVEYSGTDGSGEAVIVYDYDRLDTDYAKDVKLKSTSIPSGERLFEYLIRSGVSYVIENNGNLKNGDNITIKWNEFTNVQEDLSNIRFICNDESVTVEDLEADQIVGMWNKQSHPDYYEIYLSNGHWYDVWKTISGYYMARGGEGYTYEKIDENHYIRYTVIENNKYETTLELVQEEGKLRMIANENTWVKPTYKTKFFMPEKLEYDFVEVPAEEYIIYDGE